MTRTEGVRKTNKDTLAMEMLGYFLTATLIAVFSFAFLSFASNAIIQKAILDAPESKDIILDATFSAWVNLACIIASLIVFFAFFLMFAGQKFAYILSINKGVQQLGNGDLNFKVEVLGNDELAELAATINDFSSELQAYREREEAMKGEQDELIRTLSHDIRTPLTSIISYADFLGNEMGKDGKIGEYIDVIQNKARQIQELTDILLAGGGEGSCELIDVSLMMEQLAGEFEDSLEEAGFFVECKVDMEGVSEGRVSPRDINRIFDNLYSNIVKYALVSEKITMNILVKSEKEETEAVRIIIIQKNATSEFKNKNMGKAIAVSEAGAVPLGKTSYGIGLKSINLIAGKYCGNSIHKIDNDMFEIEINLLCEKQRGK